MGLSGINPEEGKNNVKQGQNSRETREAREKEKMAKSLFNKLDKNKDGVINEKDQLNTSLLKNLNNMTLANFRKNIDEILNLTYKKVDNYNGTKATITYSIFGKIRSVDVGAQDAKEAAKKMGLDKTNDEYRNGEPIKTYGREYPKNNGTHKEYFEWNPKTKQMDWAWTVWQSNEAKEGIFDKIKNTASKYWEKFSNFFSGI